MSNATTAQTTVTISKSDIHQAATDAICALVGVKNSRQYVKGINTAEDQLISGKWAWFADLGILKIESRTRPGKWYTIGAGTCSPQCEAAQNGRICWHRCARRIIIRAQERAEALAAQAEAWEAARADIDPALVAAHQDEADELFG